MSELSVLTRRRLAYLWDKIKAYLSGIIQPAGEKEIVSVVTYSDEAPTASASYTPTDGDLYINYDDKALYEYDGSSWEEAEVSTDVLYCTDDTTHIYLYVDAETGFRDVTGSGIIIVRDITTSLEPYTTTGIYSICHKPLLRGGPNPITYYTLVVKVITVYVVEDRVRRRKTTYTQKLSNSDGYQVRTKVGSGSWSAWEMHTYAIKEEVMQLIYAGL